MSTAIRDVEQTLLVVTKKGTATFENCLTAS